MSPFKDEPEPKLTDYAQIMFDLVARMWSKNRGEETYTCDLCGYTCDLWFLPQPEHDRGCIVAQAADWVERAEFHTDTSD